MCLQVQNVSFSIAPSCLSVCLHLSLLSSVPDSPIGLCFLSPGDTVRALPLGSHWDLTFPCPVRPRPQCWPGVPHWVCPAGPASPKKSYLERIPCISLSLAGAVRGHLEDPHLDSSQLLCRGHHGPARDCLQTWQGRARDKGPVAWEVSHLFRP